MLEPEELFDVVMGRVLIFAQFDIHDFVSRVEEKVAKRRPLEKRMSSVPKSLDF